MRRHRLIPHSAALLAVIPVLVLGPTGVAAAGLGSSGGGSAGPFDAYSMRGNAACLEMTVKSGYSFVFEPDAQLPRAVAEMDAGQSRALASPADPGDSVDTAAGLLTGDVAGQLAGAPAPINQAGTTVTQNPADHVLTYPIEHASASYPDPQHPGDSTETLAGAPDLKANDPTGTVAIDAGAGRAVAGAQVALADAGYGAATSIPLAGLTIGRVSAHSEAQLLPDKVVDDSTCTVQDLTIAPPGMQPLHIGQMTATLHTERDVNGSGATATHNLTFSDVTLNGQSVSITPAGLTLPNGKQTPWPAAPPPVTLPGNGPVPTTTATFAGPTFTQQAASNGNEQKLAMTGATMTLTSAVPVPNAVPPTGVSPTPTVIVLQLANLASSAYGMSVPSTSVGSGGFGSGAYSPGYDTGSAAGNSGSGNGATNGQLAAFMRSPAPIPRWLIILVAALTQGLLFGSLYVAYRRSHAPAPAGEDALAGDMI